MSLLSAQNRVMQDQKIPRTMKLPPKVDEAYRAITKQMPSKQHWVAAAAMVLWFAEASPKKRNELMQRVKEAELPGGTFDKLVLDALRRGGLSEAGAPKYDKALTVED